MQGSQSIHTVLVVDRLTKGLDHGGETTEDTDLQVPARTEGLLWLAAGAVAKVLPEPDSPSSI